ncbi:DUF4360 domain-containing protein [Nannocystis pusilla]|uniref:DUF4360 domain-containing protein n=1 Tax=Nannocystis pusilla TaxID=889268 RepID=A0ABS7U3F4_9BACT|nr:DUF4360 domain-containing protein [Nannocystis pusilla]MBZ5714872.1 DUF4360 domain-containing protein [Nannocystis pusilla]
MLIVSAFTELQAAVLGLLASLAAPAGGEPREFTAPAEVTANDLEEVYIEDVKYFGTGCSEDTAEVVLAEDKKSFILIYREMIIDRQDESDPELQTKNCVAAVSLHIPEGLKTAVSTVVMRGSAVLDKDIRLELRSKYFYAGNPTSVGGRFELVGPYDDSFDFPDTEPFGPWSNCGESGLYGINTSMHLDAGDNDEGRALVNMEVTDVGLKIECDLKWEKC